MQRPGVIGFLLLAIAVTLLIVVPLDSSWKWPTVMFLLVAGFILLFVSAARRAYSRPNFGTRPGHGNEGMMYNSAARSGGGKHKALSDSATGGDDGGGDGGGGGD